MVFPNLSSARYRYAHWPRDVFILGAGFVQSRDKRHQG